MIGSPINCDYPTQWTGFAVHRWTAAAEARKINEPNSREQRGRDLTFAVTTEGAWESWILFMLAAIRETATWSTAKIRGIRKLLDETAEKIRRDLPKIYSRELAEIIFVNPYCRIADLVDAGIAKRQSASVYLKALVSLGLLTEIEAGREKIYTNPALLTLLSDRGATEGSSR